jgi:hypothetical protein
MKLVHDGRKYKVYSRVKLPKGFLDSDEKGYLYFVRIGQDVYKIGTACNILRRMIQHCKYYDSEIYILWISPVLSKYTTLRIEDRQKDYWKTLEGFTHVPNDRFYFPEWITSITIKVKKEYKIDLE